MSQNNMSTKRQDSLCKAWARNSNTQAAREQNCMNWAICKIEGNGGASDKLFNV